MERNRISGWPDLGPKRKCFAHVYVINYDHRGAATESGFAPDSGIRMIREPLTAAYISELSSRLNLSNFITADFLRVQYLNLLPKMLGQEDVEYVDKDGVQQRGKMFNGAGTVSVLRDMWRFTGPNSEDSQMNALSELLKEVASRMPN